MARTANRPRSRSSTARASEETAQVTITFEVSSHVNRRLDELSSTTQLGSKAQVIRQSLQLYEYVLNQQRSDQSFSITCGDVTETVPIPFLEPTNGSSGDENDRVKIVIRVNPEFKHRLDALKSTAQLKKADILRQSILFYGFVLDQQRDGAQFRIGDDVIRFFI